MAQQSRKYINLKIRACSSIDYPNRLYAAVGFTDLYRRPIRLLLNRLGIKVEGDDSHKTFMKIQTQDNQTVTVFRHNLMVFGDELNIEVYNSCDFRKRFKYDASQENHPFIVELQNALTDAILDAIVLDIKEKEDLLCTPAPDTKMIQPPPIGKVFTENQLLALERVVQREVEKQMAKLLPRMKELRNLS